MALPTSSIALSAVKTALGYTADNSLWNVGTSGLINKWSKYKPVRGTFPTSTTGTYGLDLSNWNYIQPRGHAYGEGARLGDFRGYEHSEALAFPSIQNRTSENSINNMYPSGNPATSTWRARVWNTTNDAYITPTDLGIGSYYWGLKIIVGGVTWYKTHGTLAAASSTGTAMYVDATVTGATSYQNLPYGTGTYTWTLIACSTAASAWTTSAPSNILSFPVDNINGIPIGTTGTFTVYGWITASDDDYTWSNTGSRDSGGSTIEFSASGQWSVLSKPSWITIDVEDDIGTALPNPGFWDSGTVAFFTASTNYSTSSRSGSVEIQSSDATVSIDVGQSGAPATTTYNWVSNYDVQPAGHGMSNGSTSFSLEFDHQAEESTYVDWSIQASPGGGSASGSNMHLDPGHTVYESGSLDSVIVAGDTVTILIGPIPA